MTREEFKARVSMSYGDPMTWEQHLEAVWQLHLKASNHWISVEDELPEKDNEFEDYSKLVVVTDGKDFYKGMYNYGGECWVTHDLWPIEDATYWMEVQLPQLRKEEEQ